MAIGMATRILNVNLSTGAISKEEIALPELLLLGGSRGIQAKMLHELSVGCDPLGPDNVLMVGSGTLSGTPAPSSGRVTVTTKSPATNLYAKSTAGGLFGGMLKQAGYMIIKIMGKSDSPVMLQIRDDDVSLVSAAHLWGLDVVETCERVSSDLGWTPISIACVGPAAEAGVKYAAIVFDSHSFAGRTGVGTVMAAKGLKAIAVSGTQALLPKRPEEYMEACYKARTGLVEDPGSAKYYVTGTAGSILPVNNAGSLPSYNFQTGRFEDVKRLSGPYLVEEGYYLRRKGCFSCVLSCHKHALVKFGKYAGLTVAGPEYETLSSFGSGCGVGDVDAVLKANDICNRYGMDTISAGAAVQFAMECYEKGVLSKEDTGGMELRFGDSEAMIALTEMIAKREGIGRLLGEGVRDAAKAIGGDSYKWAVESRGLEQSRVETRAANAYALAFAVNPRGPDHLHAQPIAELGMNPKAKEIIKKITGDSRYSDPTLMEKRAEIVRWHEDIFAAGDSMGICSFTTTSSYGIDEEMLAQLFSAALGKDVTASDVMLMGQRTLNVERMFNVREGHRRRDDKLPWRMMNEVLPDHKYKDAINTQEKMDRLLLEYYGFHEWDPETGIPTPSLLRRLGLDFLVDEIPKTD